MAKKGLGRGLDLLIPKPVEQAEKSAAEVIAASKKGFVPASAPEATAEPFNSERVFAPPEPAASRTTKAGEPAEQVVTLKLSKVEPNREQPRKNFDDTSLNELSESIKRYGVIQPIVVCKQDDYYEIIAGERRWRAAKKAGLTEIPVVIREYEEKEKAEVSLIENIQRENLNPIEEAAAYKQLIDEYNLTQETLAERVAKSRTAIANTLRLLKLDEKVQQMVIDGKLSGGHARALLSLESPAEQIKAANRVIDNNLNVRQTEELVKDLVKPADAAARKKKSSKKAASAREYKELETRLAEVLGTKVKILQKEKGGGKIEISYYSEDELDRLYTSINSIGE